MLGPLYSPGLAVFLLGSLNFLLGGLLLPGLLLMLSIIVISHSLLRRHLGQFIFGQLPLRHGG